MATSVALRSTTMAKTGTLFRSSLNFLRQMTTATPTPAVAPNKGKRKKRKNLFEVAQFLPNWGIGYNMAKTHWSGVSYQITKINLYKDGRHGKAWGIVHKDGLPPGDIAKKISGVHKRCWRYIKTSNRMEETTTSIPETTTPIPEIEAA